MASNEHLKKFAVCVAAVVTAGYNFFVKKTGLLALILALSGPAKELMSTAFAEIWKEILDLDEAERLDVEAAFKSALPTELSATIMPGVALFERSVQLVGRLVNSYHDAVSIIADFKTLFGI